jgi:hypothetical protein
VPGFEGPRHRPRMAQTSAFGEHLAHHADQHRRVDAYGDATTVRWLVGEGKPDWFAVHRAEGAVERVSARPAAG